MAKLSDIFLSLLGNHVQASSPSSSIPYSISPEDRIRLALVQSGNARDNIKTQSGLADLYNEVPAGQPTVNPQGSFQLNPNDASLAGLAPGTTYQPISKRRMEITPNPLYGKKPDANPFVSQTFDTPRGTDVGVSAAPISLLGQQAKTQEELLKDLYDKADSDQTAAEHEAQAAVAMYPKGVGQTALDALGRRLGFPSIVQSPQYQEAKTWLQAAIAAKQEAVKRKADLFTRMSSASGGSAGGGGSGANPPPILGTIRVKNKQTGQTGSIPQANFNAALYDQLPAGQ